MCLLFNMLLGLIIFFLPRNNYLIIWWLQSPSAVILEPKKIKFVTVSIFSSSACREVMGLNAMILIFWMFSFSPAFLLFSLTFIKWHLSSSFSFCHKCGLIFISEIIDISPGNLDSSLCFNHPEIWHGVLCIEMK